MRAALLVVTLLVTSQVFAASNVPRTYAVLSLVGDTVTLVISRQSVGSSMDRNEHQEMKVQNDLLDDTAASTAGTDLMRLEPGSKAVVFSWRDPALYEMQEAVVASSGPAKPAFAALKDVLTQLKATHLILITKHRADTQMHLADSIVGTGKLRGLGLYLDLNKRLRLIESGETGCRFSVPGTTVRRGWCSASAGTTSAAPRGTEGCEAESRPRMATTPSL